MLCCRAHTFALRDRGPSRSLWVRVGPSILSLGATVVSLFLDPPLARRTARLNDQYVFDVVAIRGHCGCGKRNHSKHCNCLVRNLNAGAVPDSLSKRVQVPVRLEFNKSNVCHDHQQHCNFDVRSPKRMAPTVVLQFSLAFCWDIKMVGKLNWMPAKCTSNPLYFRRLS